MSGIDRRLAGAAEWDRVSGERLWLNSTLAPLTELGELPTANPAPVVSALPDPLSGDLVGWYRVRLTRFPPSPEQLAEWERLVGEHRRDSVEPSLCRVCRVVFPCLPGMDARAALAAARGDAAEFDPDPLVRLSTRVLAAQRAGEGFAALLLPLLADARRVASTHRPDSDGWCPVCRDPSRLGDAQVVWPCGMYRLAATVLRQSGQLRPAPEQSD